MSKLKSKLNVVLVEDDPFYRELITSNIDRTNISSFESFDSGESMLTSCNDNLDVVLLDYGLEGDNGLKVLKKIKNLNPQIEVIFLTAQEKLEIAISALKNGAYDYIVKNDSSLARLQMLLNRIKKNKIIRLENLNMKSFKLVWGGIIVAVGLIILFLSIFHPDVIHR